VCFRRTVGQQITINLLNNRGGALTIIIKTYASRYSFNSEGVTGERKKITAMVSVSVCVLSVGKGREGVFFPRLKQQLLLQPSPPLCVHIYIYMIIIIIYIKIICVRTVWAAAAAKSSPETRGRSPGPSRLPVFYITHTHHHPIHIPFSSAQPDTYNMCACVCTSRPCALLLAELRARLPSILCRRRIGLPPHYLCNTARDTLRDDAT